MRREEKRPIEELEAELGKPTPICLHQSLEDWVRWINAATILNTILIIAIIIFK